MTEEEKHIKNLSCMKFSVLQQDLLPIVQSVSRSVGFRSTLPVLDNILLSVEGKKLKVAATNLEIGIIKFLPIGVVNEGAITIPAKTLLDLVSGLNQGKIEMEEDGEILTVRSDKFQAQINGISASEFPAIPLAEDKGISLPKQALSLSAQILFAAALDDGRPVLTGVLTEAKDGMLDLVATDGFRLAHRKIPVPQKLLEFKSLIPKRTFEEVLRVLDEEDVDEAHISTSENQNQIIFSVGEAIISSRLIEGEFPAWEKIIPQKTVTRVVVDREELLKAIKLAAVFAKGEANIVVVTTKPNSLSLQSSAKELGSQENEIEAQIEGEELKVAFNTKFLQEALSADEASQIMIEFSGPLSACLIKPVGKEGLEYIIMPVRLS